VYVHVLQIRDVPADVYEPLEKTAQSENRSIGEQIVVLLRCALNEQTRRALRRRAVFEKIGLFAVKNTDAFPSPADLLREDRNR
jgi:hypothetical protein